MNKITHESVPIENMNSRQRRKVQAEIHNKTVEISKNILQVGYCLECQAGETFMYLASEKENIMKIYCTNCYHIDDFRDIDKKPVEEQGLFFKPSLITKTLIETYGEAVIEELLK